MNDDQFPIGSLENALTSMQAALDAIDYADRRMIENRLFVPSALWLGQRNLTQACEYIHSIIHEHKKENPNG